VQTEKLASLGQLTVGIAHENKNPLNFVNNFAAQSVELVDELDDVLKPAALDNKTWEGAEELTQRRRPRGEQLLRIIAFGDRSEKNHGVRSRKS
jgi:two-component system NtrC family sensor kinase